MAQDTNIDFPTIGQLMQPRSSDRFHLHTDYMCAHAVCTDVLTVHVREHNHHMDADRIRMYTYVYVQIVCALNELLQSAGQ